MANERSRLIKLWLQRWTYSLWYSWLLGRGYPLRYSRHLVSIYCTVWAYGIHILGLLHMHVCVSVNIEAWGIYALKIRPQFNNRKLQAFNQYAFSGRASDKLSSRIIDQTLNLRHACISNWVAWDVFYGIHMGYIKLLDSAKKNEQGAASKTGIKLWI